MNEFLDALAVRGLFDGTFILLERGADGSAQLVEVSDFERMFGAAFNQEDVYSALVTADDNGDGTTKGYQCFFDAWHAAGII